MFTGIITEVSKVVAARNRGGNRVILVEKPMQWDARAGASVSVNGICSTVVFARRGALQFDYMPETLRKTTAGFWKKGESVNLEKSLRVGDEMGGHIVTGHIEGVGSVKTIVNDGGSRLFKIEVPLELFSRIVKKGSVAVNGVSLTVADVGDNWFSVALIPYTVKHTNLRERQVGDKVNIETDILAKYSEKRKAKN